MKTKAAQRLILILVTLFLGSILLESCAASKPGFNSGGKRGMKVKSSGKMYK